MRVAPALLGGRILVRFSAATQLAALAAVVSDFWEDVTHLIRSSLYAVTNGQFDNWYFRLSVGIVLATIESSLQVGRWRVCRTHAIRL